MRTPMKIRRMRGPMSAAICSERQQRASELPSGIVYLRCEVLSSATSALEDAEDWHGLTPRRKFPVDV